MIVWFCLSLLTVGSVSALTDPAIKYPGLDLYLESSELQWQTPDWFVPHSLASAPTDFAYRREVLPYPQHRDEDLYLVIPQLGLVTPIVEIPEGSADEQLMTQGQDIDINKYLTDGIIEYVQSVDPGTIGKRIDFGHSNFFRNQPGEFKSIFANLMWLDAGDEVWYYQKNTSGTYERYRYQVTRSYPTDPSNVGALRYDGEGADALIFGCYYGLDGRWMIEATYLGQPRSVSTQPVDEYSELDARITGRIDEAIRKISYLGTLDKKLTIIQLRNALRSIENTASTLYQQQVIAYTTRQLLAIYPNE